MSLMDQARLYHGNIRPCEIMPAFKVDEGYSEDNRSQDDADSPAKFEVMASDMNRPTRMLAGLPEGIMALSEAERSGMLVAALCQDLSHVQHTLILCVADQHLRLRIQYITDLADVVYSCDSGATEATSPYRSSGSVASRNHGRNILLSHSLNASRSVEGIEILARIYFRQPALETEIQSRGLGIEYE